MRTRIFGSPTIVILAAPLLLGLLVFPGSVTGQERLSPTAGDDDRVRKGQVSPEGQDDIRGQVSGDLSLAPVRYSWLSSDLVVPGDVMARPLSSETRVGWILIGAGVGFGLGLFAGLSWYDDAINSDQKVWTTAAAGAAVGAVASWLIQRAIAGTGEETGSR